MSLEIFFDILFALIILIDSFRIRKYVNRVEELEKENADLRSKIEWDI